MQSFLRTHSSSSSSSSSSSPQSLALLRRWNPNSLSTRCFLLFFFSAGPSPLLRTDLSLSHERKSKRGLFVAAAKKRKSKPDSHSFVPKPDEATGPFPEALLLREKTVKEDGRLLPEFADADEETLYEFLSLQLESDLNLEKMRHYEVVFLIHEDRVDEVESVTTKVQEFIREKKGRIWRLNDWGLRRLAYKIQKAKKANYILMNFEIDAKYINDFKGMLDKDERIIRHLVMKRDEAITKDCPPPPEFHTLHMQDMDEEEEEEDEMDDEDEDWDDNDEAEMASTDVSGGYNIIDVDEEEDGRGNVARRDSKVKAEKIAR